MDNAVQARWVQRRCELCRRTDIQTETKFKLERNRGTKPGPYNIAVQNHGTKPGPYNIAVQNHGTKPGPYNIAKSKNSYYYKHENGMHMTIIIHNMLTNKPSIMQYCYACCVIAKSHLGDNLWIGVTLFTIQHSPVMNNLFSKHCIVRFVPDKALIVQIAMLEKLMKKYKVIITHLTSQDSLNKIIAYYIGKINLFRLCCSML